VLVLAPSAFGMAFPQSESGPSAADKVKNFAVAVRDVVRIGGPATPILATLAKSESTATLTLVNWIGQSIKDKAAPAGLDTAPSVVEPQAKAMVAAAAALLGLRERALEPIAAAAADTANADVKPYLEKAESRVYVALCATVIRGYLGPNQSASGTYDGMFASLEKYNRDKVGDAFLDLLAAKGQQTGVRGLAGEGLAQMGSKRHIEPLNAMLKDPNNKDMSQRIVYTLARLGDRTIVDKHLAKIAAEMEKLKKPDMTPQEIRGWAEGYHQRALVLQNIHDTESAIKEYELFLAAVEPIKDKLGAKGGVSELDYYNLACLYSIKGDADNGLKNLEKSFVAGYANYKWLATDGDLTNLRKDPRYKALVEKWESGKGAAEGTASKPS
jgi:hypothetical protein